MVDDLKPGSDLRYDLELSLKEAAAVLPTTLSCPRLVRCTVCGGAGAVWFGNTPCSACAGVGVASRYEEIKVRIPAGVDEGSRIRIPGKGNESKSGRAGDLYLVTHVPEHEKFKRKGDNLYSDAFVSAESLASGTVIDVQTLTDGMKKLRIPANTKEGTTFRFRGYGMTFLRDPNQRGDLFVTVRQTEPTAAEDNKKHADGQHDTSKSDLSEKTAVGLRVFLCHSSGDKPAVRALYYRLRADGIIPWLDEEDLLPGEKWEKEIPKAVRSCDIVIVCLSQGSINKRGYLQKEIRYALDAAEEQPEGTIFLIPLKLEECEIPEHLSGWQWVNFFEEKGYERLMRALRKRARSL